MKSREVVEGRQIQGEDEQIPFQLDTSNWTSAPTVVSVVVKDATAGLADVTTTVLPGSVTVSTSFITFPKLKSLTPGHTYRVEVKFTGSLGEIFEAYFIVAAEV